MNENTFAELAAGYALNALSPSDRKAFEAALAEHPDWEKHVRTEADTVALLSDSIGPVTPPAAIRDALLARIAVTAQTPSGDYAEEDFAAAGPAPVTASAEPAGSADSTSSAPEAASVAPGTPSAAPGTPSAAPASASRPKRRWFTLAASVVLLLALGFGTVVVSQQLTRPAAVVALEQIENAPDAQSASIELPEGGEATAHWSTSLGEVVFESDGLPVLEGDKTFELWFVRDEGAISAGTFAAEGGSATALLSGTYEPGDVIAVTVEPAGGAPGGIPTGDPILAITTA